MRGGCTRQPFEGLEGHLEEALRDFAHHVLQEHQRARRDRHRRNKQPGIITMALDTLRRSSFAAVQTDKDGGFCLIHKACLHQEIFDIMKGPEYEQAKKTTFTTEDIVRGFVEIAVNIGARHSDNQLKAALLSDIGRYPYERAFSRLQVTIKSHKADGEVGMRAIHSSSGSPPAPGYRFISFCLRPVISSMRHLMRDSFSVTQRLDSTIVPHYAKFIKVDIHVCFFMSGRHRSIIERCKREVDEEFAESFAEVATYALANQYIQVDAADDLIWKARHGSGMGLSCAGDLSNVTYYSLAEKDFVCLESTRAKYGIIMYMRYMDDILIVNDGQSFYELFAAMKIKAQYFELKAEEVSMQGVRFLDLYIHKGPRHKASRLLDYRVARKETHIGRPLAPSSAHHPAVHYSWLVALLRRAERLSSSSTALRFEIEYLRGQWKMHNIRDPSIAEQHHHQHLCGLQRCHATV